MNEFKFRVWDKRLKRYLGEYDPTPMLMSNGNLAYLDDAEMEFYEVEQCTDLKDKNGTLIYEGDILAVPYVDPIFMQPVNMEINNNVAYVEFYKGCFVAHYPERQMKYLYYYENTAEVIGNIHENKKLLDD